MSVSLNNNIVEDTVYKLFLILKNRYSLKLRD